MQLWMRLLWLNFIIICMNKKTIWVLNYLLGKLAALKKLIYDDFLA
jgi:hypothetical protein